MAIRELTPKYRKHTDYNKRAEEFRSLFETTSSYLGNISPSYFQPCTHGASPSLFNEHSNKVLDCFTKRWNPDQRKRQEYLTTFSMNNWKKLSEEEKNKHTISRCDECFLEHRALQEAFPTKTVYTPQSVAVLEKELKATVSSLMATQSTPRSFGTSITNTLDPLCRSSLGTPLSKVLANTPGTSLQIKATPTARKQERRHMIKTVKRKLEEQYEERDTELVLQNRLSWSKYNVLRMDQSFESQDVAQRRVAEEGIKTKKHGVNRERLQIDVDALLQPGPLTLQSTGHK